MLRWGKDKFVAWFGLRMEIMFFNYFRKNFVRKIIERDLGLDKNV